MVRKLDCRVLACRRFRERFPANSPRQIPSDLVHPPQSIRCGSYARDLDLARAQLDTISSIIRNSRILRPMQVCRDIRRDFGYDRLAPNCSICLRDAFCGPIGLYAFARTVCALYRIGLGRFIVDRL